MATGLDGKIAIVTGAARGQGLAAARALLEAGAAVAISDIGRADLPTVGYPLGTSEALAAAEAELRGIGCVLAVGCDVRRDAEVTRLIERTVTEFGGIDIVVNNAGVLTGGKPAQDTDDETWATVIDINLTGVFRVSRAAIPHLIARGGGRIINIASVAGLVGTPNFAAYCASKHGVVGLTKAMAGELADHGVTVNAICPGAVDTKMVQHSMQELAAQMGGTVEEAWQTILAVHLIKRPITPEQIGAGVAYLASEAAAMVTGSCLSIDGGWSTT